MSRLYADISRNWFRVRISPTDKKPGDSLGVFPYDTGDKIWGSVASSDIDLDGNIISGEGEINFTGYVIHGAIHKTRNDLHCVMHSHSRAGLAVSCLKNGLEILIQDSAMFHNRISYH